MIGAARARGQVDALVSNAVLPPGEVSTTSPFREHAEPRGGLHQLAECQTAWVLFHKLREAMATEMKGFRLGGEGKIVEVDGGYFGGYVKPANQRVRTPTSKAS